MIYYINVFQFPNGEQGFGLAFRFKYKPYGPIKLIGRWKVTLK